MTPEQVAAELWQVDADRLTATRIKGGLTNESWSVQGEHESVVVRISTADEQALQLNRSSEAAVLWLVERAGIGAQVLLCEPERRVLVTRQLNAHTLTAEAMQQSDTIKKVALLLRHLHSLSTPASVQHTNLIAILHGYWRSLDTLAIQHDSSEVRARAREIAEESACAPQRCLCHNDVHHLNLMSDERRLWLLDWEYAGVGDPFFDLASVCCYHDYDQPLREQLLIAYRGELLAAEHTRLGRMCWLFDYINGLWFAVRNSKSE